MLRSTLHSHGYRWVDRSTWSADEELAYAHKAIDAIRTTSGKPPVGQYYGMVNSQASVRSRALTAQAFREQGLPLKYYSDDYSDDLPHCEWSRARRESQLMCCQTQGCRCPVANPTRGC